MTTLPKNHKLIPGAAGDLEIVFDKPKNNIHPNKLLIICHPHPKYLGTMNNKVVTTISKAARNLGLTALRFNFRGVENSSGSYDHGNGEVEDILAVTTWVQQHSPNVQEIILSGFSFGGAIAYKALSKMPLACSHLITVAPAIINFPVSSFPEPTVPWLIIQGDNDDIVLSTTVFQWLTTKIDTNYTLSKFHATGHFFHGKLIELRKEIEYYLKSRI